jgi:hypothetical protein
MQNQDESHLKRVSECWRTGQPLEAGRLMDVILTRETRPKWAARILRLVLEKSKADRSHFERILYTADHPSQWANGHRCFDILRDATLELDELRRKRRLTKEQDMLASLLLLAELVAKVTYNAVDPPDPFDEDSGWWIAASLGGFVDTWSDEEFSKTAWSALCNEEKVDAESEEMTE